MKMNWMKYVGMTVFAGAVFGSMPAQSFADEGEQEMESSLEEESTILDVQLDNLPIVGDVSVQLPKKSESEDAALVHVEVSDGAVGDVQA